jgi:outer membrane protein OmpA-like peptidoglycan-associated protein
MQSYFKTLLALVLCFSCCTFYAYSQTSSKDVRNNQTNDFNLYAAVIDASESGSMSQQDGGIIGKKANIRIINLGPVVNFGDLDYAPTISADGRTLFYVSNRDGSKKNKDGENSHDFWATKKAERLDTNFSTPFNIDTTTAWGNLGVNTPLNEGAASIAADRQTLYFTGCNRPDGLGSCDLYVTEIEGDKWGKPRNLGPNVNSEKWDSQPSITAGKDRLYFASARPGPNGEENFDIWYCDWDDNTEEFKPAKNLTQVNTKGKEVGPFIGADGVTLFFSSDGYQPNYGGLDFYVTRYDQSTDKWSVPENLGEPINTAYDDQFITLPASGDIIYFSSKRNDLKGYQGNFDVFMAFVPSFYKTKIVKITVIDECSQEFIPSKVIIKNPITGKVITDSVTVFKKELETIVSNADYGNVKDDIQYVNLEVSAENPRYGKAVSKIVRVDKPAKTEVATEAGKTEDEIKVTITLGQMPVLATEIDEAAYIRDTKAKKPELDGYKGLVMVQFQTWDLYPLLNYVFFDLGKSDIPNRYILFSKNDETKFFADTTIAGGTLDKYYHVLNIYGFRLTQFPDAKLEIVGCNDGTTAEEKKPNLSKDRATNVFNYLKDVWNIDEKRMKLTFRDKPARVSNLKDSLGITENRRVELICSDWDVMKPVFDKDPKTFPQPEQMTFTMENGIENLLVAKRRIEITRGGQVWKTLNDVGTTEPKFVWDWRDEKNKYPKDDVAYTAQLIVTTQTGKECKSIPIDIPVKQVSLEEKKVAKMADSTLERYSLILFPFDSPEAGPINDRIMKDYVYNRCMPTSNIEVIGHTDVVGLYDHNQRLSDKRSFTVYNGIMKTTNSKVGKITKRGVGEDEPLYDNILPEGRFYNRTVYVIIKTPLEIDDKK